MKKGWHIILGIVIVALIVGALSMGVGFLTGADSARILQNLDDHFQLRAYVDAYKDYAVQLFQYLKSLF
ncbi:MAG: hypothetical protein K6C12_00905 [Oscillospiraceae bacterium]|nr:hypothetical protein [Oscillospiraceae bacterium]